MRRIELQSKVILTVLGDDPVDLPFILLASEMILNESSCWSLGESGKDREVTMRFHFDNTTVKEVI